MKFMGVLQRFVAMLAKPIRRRWTDRPQSGAEMTFLVKGPHSVWLGEVIATRRHYHKDDISMEV
jgi:hypothetical protein